MSWRCLLGPEQKKVCAADGGFCYTGVCPHGEYIPKGESTRQWRARIRREWPANKAAAEKRMTDEELHLHWRNLALQGGEVRHERY